MYPGHVWGRGSLVLLAACGRVGFDAAADRDAATDGPDAPVCLATFCDGFEDPALAAWTGTDTNGAATAVRDGAFGYRGASLHATSPVGSNVAVRSVDVFATMPAEIWVRAFIYAPLGMVLDVEPIELTNAGPDHQLVVSLYDDGTDIHSHNFGADVDVGSMNAPPRDRWVCYELQVKTGVQGSIGLYQEGTAEVVAPLIDVQPPANDLRRVRVGVASKPASLGENVFVDEVAVGATRIGCN